MKVLYVIESCDGGSARNVMDLAIGMHSRGLEVSLIWSPTRASEEWLRFISQAPFRTVSVPMVTKVGIADLKTIIRLYKVVSNLGTIDIIHAHSSMAGFYCRIVAFFNRAKMVYTPHAFKFLDKEINHLLRIGVGLTESLLSRLTDAIICVSQFEYDCARKFFIGENKLEIVVNCIDTHQSLMNISERHSNQVIDNGFVVGFIGRLERQKNPHAYIECVLEANRMDRSIRGVVLGDGPLLEELVNYNGVKGVIEFRGWVDVKDHLNQMDLVLCTSHYEAMPYVFLDALSACLPIFSLKVGGTDEAIRHKWNGLVFEQSESMINIAKKIVELSRNEEEISMFRRNSKALLEREFSKQKMLRETLTVYNKCKLIRYQ